MTDMGPRRMDGFARPSRPAGAPGAQAPLEQPALRPQRPPESLRPVAQPRPVTPPRPVGQPMQQLRPADDRAAEPQQQVKPATAKKGGAWKVVLQFVVGLLVIVGVAGAIVMLYIKYYQQ